MKDGRAADDILQLLHEWDETTRERRKRICSDFYEMCAGKTAPELDAAMAQGGSLFLARLTSCLRVSYMHSPLVPDLIKAISIFVQAAGGGEYVREFVEVGGIITLIEIVCLRQAPESHKAAALHLIYLIALSGKNYKEMICDAYGVRAAAECLAQAQEDETQENARLLLATVAESNPRYTEQVYGALVALLGSQNARAQHLAAATLRHLQGLVPYLHPALVPATLNLLKSPSLDVQTEAAFLIAMIAQRGGDTRMRLLQALVDCLSPIEQTSSKVIQAAVIIPPRAIDVQQASAAKIVRLLAEENSEFCNTLLEMNVVRGLLVSLGNLAYPDSQRKAATSLTFFSQMSPAAVEECQIAMGPTLYLQFMADPQTIYNKITPVQADALVHCQTRSISKQSRPQ